MQFGASVRQSTFRVRLRFVIDHRVLLKSIVSDYHAGRPASRLDRLLIVVLLVLHGRVVAHLATRHTLRAGFPLLLARDRL